MMRVAVDLAFGGSDSYCMCVSSASSSEGGVIELAVVIQAK